MRKLREIQDHEHEFCDKVWHERHLVLMEKVERWEENICPKILKWALASAEKVRKKYKDDNLEYDTFERWMLNWKLSALRWILWDDWDELYT